MEIICKNIWLNYVIIGGFLVLIAVTMTTAVLLDVTPCSLLEAQWHFRGTYSLQLPCPYLFSVGSCLGIYLNQVFCMQLSWLTLQPRRWRQYVSSKHFWISTGFHASHPRRWYSCLVADLHIWLLLALLHRLKHLKESRSHSSCHNLLFEILSFILLPEKLKNFLSHLRSGWHLLF